MTVKQRKVAKLVEKGGSMKDIMLAAGYSPNTAKTPTKLTKTKGWQKLLEEKLPDEELLEKHRALLNKQEYIAIGKAGEREVIPTGELDPGAVGKGLDMAYKLKGRYSENVINQQFNTGEMSIQFREAGTDENI